PFAIAHRPDHAHPALPLEVADPVDRGHPELGVRARPPGPLLLGRRWCRHRVLDAALVGVALQDVLTDIGQQEPEGFLGHADRDEVVAGGDNFVTHSSSSSPGQPSAQARSWSMWLWCTASYTSSPLTSALVPARRSSTVLCGANRASAPASSRPTRCAA